MRKIAFAPVINKNSQVLFLGTMPSEESLRRQQYYGHPSNQFWKILYTLYQEPLPSDYSERVAFVLSKKLAIWDVLQSCEGQGSLDSCIKNEIPNDFSGFYKNYPSLKTVCFTSKKAEEFYRKYVGFDTAHAFLVLPSPSPANARMSLSEKVEKWHEILESVLSLL